MFGFSQRNANGKSLGLLCFGGNGHRPPALWVEFIYCSWQPAPTQSPFVSFPNSPQLLLELESLPHTDRISTKQIKGERFDRLFPPSLGSLLLQVQNPCLQRCPWSQWTSQAVKMFCLCLWGRAAVGSLQSYYPTEPCESYPPGPFWEKHYNHTEKLMAEPSPPRGASPALPCLPWWYHHDDGCSSPPSLAAQQTTTLEQAVKWRKDTPYSYHPCFSIFKHRQSHFLKETPCFTSTVWTRKYYSTQKASLWGPQPAQVQILIWAD